MSPSPQDLEKQEETDLEVDESMQMGEVTQRFDQDGKGYLTPAEAKVRKMASVGGSLSNDKVIQVVEESMILQQSNKQLKTYLWVSAAMVIILALANLGTAFAAARLAKDTEVDNGALVTTDGNNRVSTVATSAEEHRGVVLEEDPDPATVAVCIDPVELGRMYNQTMAGTPTILQTDSVSDGQQQ